MEEALCLRDGDDALVISSGLAGLFHLPPRCVVCNEEGATRIRKTLDRKSLVAFTPVLYATSSIALNVEFSLCAHHLRRRRIELVVVATGVLLAATATALLDMRFISVGLVVLFALGVVLARRYQLPRLLHLDPIQAKIKVGRAFACSFAESPSQV